MLLKESIQPRWGSLKQACIYGHIGKARLKQLAKEGLIKGFPDPDNKRGDWIFDLKSIDEYRESQISQPSVREKALEIIREIRYE